MLTVKFRNERTRRTRNVECVEACVEPGDGVARVLLKKPAGAPDETVEVFRPQGDEDGADFHIAFVENSQGATIQVVRP